MLIHTHLDDESSQSSATMYATRLAAVPFHRHDLGETGQVSRVLWSTHSPTSWLRAFDFSKEKDLEALQRRFNLGPTQIAEVISYIGCQEHCFAALATHRSRVNVDSPWWRAFSPIGQVVGAGKAYPMAVEVPLPEGDPANDLFSGFEG